MVKSEDSVVPKTWVQDLILFHQSLGTLEGSWRFLGIFPHMLNEQDTSPYLREIRKSESTWDTRHQYLTRKTNHVSTSNSKMAVEMAIPRCQMGHWGNPTLMQYLEKSRLMQKKKMHDEKKQASK